MAAEEAESKTPCLTGPAAGTQAPYAVCAAQREAQRKEAPAGAAAAAAGAAAEEQSEPEDLDGDLRAGKGVLGVAERWQRLLAMAGSHSALLTTGLRLRGTRRALTRVRPADVMGDQAYDREDEWIDDTDIHPASSNVQEERPATDGYFVNHGFLKTKRDDAYAARPRLPSASLTPPPPRRATAAPRTRPAATSTRTARRRRSSRRRRASGAHAAPRSPCGSALTAPADASRRRKFIKGYTVPFSQLSTEAQSVVLKLRDAAKGSAWPAVPDEPAPPPAVATAGCLLTAARCRRRRRCRRPSRVRRRGSAARLRPGQGLYAQAARKGARAL